MRSTRTAAAFSSSRLMRLVPGIGATSSPWVQEPGERQLRGGAPHLGGDLASPLDEHEVAFAVLALEAREVAAAARVVLACDLDGTGQLASWSAL
ncbi:MAG TPA: hypothetical protein VG126_03860 [Thermoleophilaceae bacterium]|nr:hypothetical protein [Thermoleophilaceae bacterium]